MTGVGIAGYGVALPTPRIERATVAAAGANPPAGWRWSAVAEADEDALTLGLEAIRDLDDLSLVGSLGIASMSLPYARRVQGGLIALGASLRDDVLLSEHTTSARAGTEALLMHRAQVQVTGDDAVVVVTEVPADPIGFGSAAIALRLSPDGKLASLDTAVCGLREFPGLDFTVRGADARSDISVPDYASAAYAELVLAGVETLLARERLALDGYSAVILAGASLPISRRVAGRLGLQDRQWQPYHPDALGGAGGAIGALLGLITALERVPIGERILVTSYGGGSAVDVLALTVGEGAERRLEARMANAETLDLEGFMRRRGGP